MRAHYQGRRRRHRPQSRPFPWVRLTVASFLTVLFLLGAAFQILSSGNVISSYWLLIIPPLIAVIALLIPLYQYLLPLPTEDTATHTFQTHQPLATHPITDRQTHTIRNRHPTLECTLSTQSFFYRSGSSPHPSV